MKLKIFQNNTGEVLFIVACLFVGNWLVSHLLFPATHSISPVLLWRTGDLPTRQNEYVLFEHHDSYLPAGETHLVKRLGCMPGQHLSRLNRQFYCDGQFLGIAQAMDSRGEKLPLFEWQGVIPKGKAFAVGDTDNSYDSRYWGLMDLLHAERVIPLF